MRFMRLELKRHNKSSGYMIWAPTMRQLVIILNSSSWSIFQISTAFFVLSHFSFCIFRSAFFVLSHFSFHPPLFIQTDFNDIAFYSYFRYWFVFFLLKQQNWVTNVNLWFANFKLYCKSMSFLLRWMWAWISTKI